MDNLSREIGRMRSISLPASLPHSLNSLCITISYKLHTLSHHLHKGNADYSIVREFIACCARNPPFAIGQHQAGLNSGMIKHFCFGEGEPEVMNMFLHRYQL